MEENINIDGQNNNIIYNNKNVENIMQTLKKEIEELKLFIDKKEDDLKNLIRY